MRRIKTFVLVATLETISKGLVQPYFEYFSPLWKTCHKLLKDKLYRFQSRAARVLTGSSYEIRSALFFGKHLMIDGAVQSHFNV